MEHLAKDQPLRKLVLPETEAKAISSYGLMTAKPILYIANVDEDDLHGEGKLATEVRNYATSIGCSVVPVCAKLEAELAELDDARSQRDARVSRLDSTRASQRCSSGLQNARLAKLLHCR